MGVVWGGIALGQGLFAIDDPSGFQLFLLASILLSVSLIPILLTEIKAPDTEEKVYLGNADISKASPSRMGTIGD